MIHCPFFVLVQAIDDESFFDLARRSMLVFSENSGMPVYAVTSLGNVMSNRRQFRLTYAGVTLVLFKAFFGCSSRLTHVDQLTIRAPQCVDDPWLGVRR